MTLKEKFHHEVVELYKSGKTLHEVDEVAGISQSAVFHIVRGRGVKMRRPGPRCPRSRFEADTKPILIRMAESGATLEEVGQALGVCRERARQLYTRFGVARDNQLATTRPDEIQRRADCWARAKTVEEAAYLAGITWSTMVQTARKHRDLFPTKEHASRSITSRQKAMELSADLRSGMSGDELRKKYGPLVSQYAYRCRLLHPDLEFPKRNKRGS